MVNPNWRCSVSWSIAMTFNEQHDNHTNRKTHLTSSHFKPVESFCDVQPWWHNHTQRLSSGLIQMTTSSGSSRPAASHDSWVPWPYNIISPCRGKWKVPGELRWAVPEPRRRATNQCSHDRNGLLDPWTTHCRDHQLGKLGMVYGSTMNNPW